MPDKSGSSQGADSEDIRKIETRVRGLDEILHGGLPAGRTTIISGGPGAGKTVLAMETMCRGASEAEPWVFVGFEESAEQLRANAASTGMDVAALERDGKLRIISAQIPHKAVRSGDFDIHGLLAVLEGHCRQLGATRVVLDGIDVLMRIFANPQREREELYKLHDWLTDHHMTSILTVKAQSSECRPYPFLDYMGDCVLSLDQRTSNQVRTWRLQVKKYRGSSFLANEHPYVITSRGIVLMPVSLTALTSRARDACVSTGNEQFDAILNGGYGEGTSILIAGPSGVGKTALTSTFAASAARNGRKVLYVSFEESAAGLVAEGTAIGLDLQGSVDDGAVSILDVMPESTGVEAHLLSILVSLDEYKPDHLVVDPVSAVERMGSPRAGFDLLVRLLAVCKARGITCLLTRQATESDPIEQVCSSPEASLVDCFLSLRYEDDGRRLRRKLVVVKARGRTHSMDHYEFRITAEGLRFDGAPGAEAAEGAER
ncbi:MAG: circadian clock protein KaiC [Phycisphaerae bacterium]